MIFDYLFLPFLFFIGAITAYQDFKYGKIKNKWILLGLAWGIGVYLFFCLWLLGGNYFSFFTKAGNYVSYSYVFQALLNAIVSLIVGYVIWYFDLWSAGDAKLFFVFSLLLPLAYYRRGFLPYFPSFALLINIFVPALVFLFFNGTFRVMKGAANKSLFSFGGFSLLIGRAKGYLKENYPSFVKSFLAFSLIFLFFRIFRQTAFAYAGKYQLAASFSFLLFFSASRFLRRLLKKTYILLSFGFIFMAYLAISGLGGLRQTLAAAKNSSVFLFIFPLMALIFSFSQKKDQHKKMPFAAWLFLGVILTLILKGSLISFLPNPQGFWR